jgi:hypothetical protein
MNTDQKRLPELPKSPKLKKQNLPRRRGESEQTKKPARFPDHPMNRSFQILRFLLSSVLQSVWFAWTIENHWLDF